MKQIIKIIGPQITTWLLIILTIGYAQTKGYAGADITIISILSWLYIKDLIYKQASIKKWWGLAVQVTGIIGILAFAFRWLGSWAFLGLAIYIIIIGSWSIGKNWKLYDYYTTWAAGRLKGKKDDFDINKVINDGQGTVQERDGSDSEQRRTRKSPKQSSKPVDGPPFSEKNVPQVFIKNDKPNHETTRKATQESTMPVLPKDLRRGTRKREEAVK